MRVLQVHNYYQIAGGEDTVVRQELAMLREHGMHVDQWTVSNDHITGATQKLRTAFSSTYSVASRKQMAQQLQANHPDVVHVHNFFPLLTPSIYDACLAANVPVVQTLHNFRPICAGAILWRDGAVCEKCIGGSSLPAIRHKCYRQSRLGSSVLARMVDHHKRARTWHEKVTLFLTPSAFARDKFIEAGFPADKVIAKPNFVHNDDAAQESLSASRKGALFVGRLTPEKGIETMLDAWQGTGVSLDVIGDGPMREDLQSRSLPADVSILGARPYEDVLRAMYGAQFLVMPSIWYETFGMTIVEAFRCKLPVIASNIGAVAELVIDGETGLTFKPGDANDLAKKIEWALENPREMTRMADKAYLVFARDYTPERNFRLMKNIYEDAVALSAKESG